MKERLNDYTNKFIDLLFYYTPKLIMAIAILVVGFWLTSFITKTVKKIMRKRGVEQTLISFAGNLIFWMLRILVIITVISKLGVETSSFVAIFAAAGLAIGLALQGSLANFAGGVLIILFKPFKIDDYIEAQGEIGTVKEIQIFNTKLLSANNETIYIPNGILSNGVMKNYTQEGIRRLDLTIGVGYDSDLKLVKETIMKVLENHPMVVKTPAPSTFVSALADSSINMSIRPWCEAGNYLKVYGDVLEQCKVAFDEMNIEIPYPHQVEIHK